MTRDDLIGALKNALDRGAPLEQAIRSFVTAGYQERDVREAAEQIQRSVLVSSSKPGEKPQVPQTQRVAPVVQQPPQTQQFSQAPVQRPQPVQQPQFQQPQQFAQQAQQPRPAYYPQQYAQTQSPYSMQVPTAPQYPYSPYPTKPESQTPWVTITLVIILLILLGLFGASLLYREQLVDFFKGILVP